MAKSVSCGGSDGNHTNHTHDSNEFTFEQLEMSCIENDEPSNDSLPVMSANNRRVYSNVYSNRTSNENALQRNRNHYSGHYCHIHHTHHQHYHSSHSNHSNHSTHNHNHSHNNSHNNHNHNNHNIHNNRNNSHSNHCNQQEIGVNEEEDETISQLGSHSSHGQQQHYTLDQSEFERIWRQLDNNKNRYNFLRSLYRSSPSGNLVFSEISFGSLGEMASALSEFDDTVDDFCFVVYILGSLSRAKRFLLSLQFLTSEERDECKKLFNKLWKSMNDKQQDLAENDISELTINELMKSYEIAIESNH